MFKYENMNICCTDQVTFSPSALPKIHNFWAGGFNIKSFHITRSSCPGPLVCQGPARVMCPRRVTRSQAEVNTETFQSPINFPQDKHYPSKPRQFRA